MPYEIELTQAAHRDYMSLPSNDRERIRKAIDTLELDPRPTGVRKIQGMEKAWRLRVSSYRILYEVDDREQKVVIYRVRHRRDVYR